MKVKPSKKINSRASPVLKEVYAKYFLSTLCLLCMYFVWCGGESEFLLYEPLICISYLNQNRGNSLY